MKEKLSAFVDNELSELEERQVLAALEVDAELRAKWERYHLIRSIMRSEIKDQAPVRVSAAVAGAIAGDPAYRVRPRFASIALKTAGGLAIAATVAAVAILSVYSPSTPRTEVAATTAKAPAVVPASNGAVAREALTRDSLNAYLLEHSEVAPTAGMGNMLPYVRTVNDNDQ